jgi:hypothetical protein
MRTASAAAEKLMALCFDMEEALNEAFDATHATHLIGHGLREFANEPPKPAPSPPPPGSPVKRSKRSSKSGATCSKPQPRRLGRAGKGAKPCPGAQSSPPTDHPVAPPIYQRFNRK